MDSPQKMDVVDWHDAPPPVLPKARAPRRFLSPTLIGFLGTLLLHTMVIQSLPFGNGGPKAKPPEAQESADARSKFKGDSAESLVLVALPTPTNSNQAAPQFVLSSLPDLSKMKIKSPVNVELPALANLETLALNENQTSDSRAQGGDGAEQARLFGIYTGQIQARIDRVWRRPRTPVNEDNAAATDDAGDSFQCEAQIVQGAGGNVQEILLPRCNGSDAWRRSLIMAIRHASPLPAPPSPGVFSQSITLNFIGVSFVAGESEDDYEPERRSLVGAQ
jgi:hypothetical protein